VSGTPDFAGASWGLAAFCATTALNATQVAHALAMTAIGGSPFTASTGLKAVFPGGASPTRHVKAVRTRVNLSTDTRRTIHDLIRANA
jgi:hypothetical protein